MLSITHRLNTWIPQVQGLYINMDWNPTNKGFGAQCWDLAAHWSVTLGLPIINTGNYPPRYGRWPGWAGNMVDCFPQTPAIAAAYTLHGPNTTGQPGDIVVWGDSNKVWYPATHVAVLVFDKGVWLTCMSLNSTPSRADNPFPEWTSGPTTIQSLPRQGLLGFIRPNVGGLASAGSTTPTTSEEDDMIDPKEWAIVKLQLAGLVDSSAQRHKDTSERLDDLPAKILTKPFPRIGTDGKRSGETNLQDVIGASEANVTISRALAGAQPAAVVDALIAANIAEEVAALIGKKLAA